MNRALPTVLALALAAGACRDRDDALDRALDLLPPVAMGGGLLYVERSGGHAYFLDLARDGAVQVTTLGRDPVASVPRASAPGAPDRAETLVLTRGSRGATGEAPEPGQLAVIGAAGATRRYVVGSPFNGVAQTLDGRFAFVFFRPSTAQGRLLFNPNEVAIANLESPPSPTNPALRTVRSFGGIPNDVVFSPPMNIGGASRRFAVVLSDAYVTLMDLDHLDRPEVTVRLTLPEDPRAIRPTQVVFDTDDPSLYVRAEASNDVYVLRLNAATPEGPTGNDYRPTINQLAAGRSPADMALIGEGESRRLLVVAAGSVEARVINARSNTITVVPLEARAERILLYTGPSPRDAADGPRAFLYATSGATAVTFLDLAAIEDRRGQNVETLQLARPIFQALPLPERNAVMLGHAAEAAGGRLSLLDLRRRTAAPIYAEVSLEGATFDNARQTLWVAPRFGTRIGFIDLATFHPGEVRLDDAASDVVPLVGDPAGRNRVAVVHQRPEGYVTVLDALDPRRETAVSHRGFILDNLLDRVAP